jgi:nucleoside-diphosphate-sugar epimerase
MKRGKNKVIVTGGAGFIGSHVSDLLLARGFKVYVIDNLSAGRKENMDSRVVFYKADIRDFEKIAPIFVGAKYVFHLAAWPRVQPSIIDPRTTYDINVTGALNVFLAARNAKAKRIIYSASSSAYGNQKILPIKEEMTPNPLSPYGLQKYIGELQCRLFSQIYGIETVSLRYFNVYGPRAPHEGDYALVVSKFLAQCSRGEPMTIVPDGKQSRDMVHARDVARANLLAAESPAVGKGEVINIGGKKNYSVLEIAKIIGGKTVFIKPRLEPKHTLADISKAKKLLGWKPEITLEQGIRELKEIYGVK